MIDTDELLRRANFEIGRLNRELAAIHEEEERCKLRRSRAETEKAKVQLLIDQYRLVRRLSLSADDTPAAAESYPKVLVHNGDTWLTHKDGRVSPLSAGAWLKWNPDSPNTLPPAPQPAPKVPGRQKHKPDGLPTVSEMIIAALREVGKASRPVEIADYVRKRWWPDLQTTTICAQVWQLAKLGKLTSHDGRYAVNGAINDATGA